MGKRLIKLEPKKEESGLKVDMNDCRSGAPIGVTFKTGVHPDKKKDANKKACRLKPEEE